MNGSDELNKSKLQGILDSILSLPFAIAFLLISSLYYIYNSSSGGEGGIANIDYARGLITLLFAVGTIAIALILTISALFQSGDEAKERYDRGREILGVLIGIFGTIVGFYFGSANSESVLAANEPPSITTFDPDAISMGATATINITTANRADGSTLFALISGELIELESKNRNFFQLNVDGNMTKEAGDLSIRLFDESNGQLSSPFTVEIKKTQ